MGRGTDPALALGARKWVSVEARVGARGGCEQEFKTMASMFPSIRRLAVPLRSRKVRVALTTAIGAIAVELGFDVPQELVLSMVGIGATLILAIAHEDNGRHAASLHHQPGEPSARTETIP